ncbi:MAG: (2Fe-2S)-binding protein [Proteobacteria bacterium]|nr:(2Fe-2S)-binding protein [Pseudomonadota bacterium]
MTEIDIQFTVNDTVKHVKAEPTRTLLSVLREDVGLTGTKDGCSSGDCGACVILQNGRVVNSCMVLAPQAEGSEIITIEGLAVEGQLHPLQRAFGETWAFQCGFCTPGMLISCYALLLSNDNPSREEILTAISGNFCRCTGYQYVVTAVQQAATEMRATTATGEVQHG